MEEFSAGLISQTLKQVVGGNMAPCSRRQRPWLDVFELQLLLRSSLFYAAEQEHKLHLSFPTSALRIWGIFFFNHVQCVF